MRSIGPVRLRLERTCLAALLCAPFLLSDANAQATYSYTGISLGTSGVYVTDTTISASFTLAAPLPPDSTTDLTDLMTSYSFTDGVQTLTEDNSTFEYTVASMTTDGAGMPQEWSIYVYATPLPDAVGEPISGIWFLYIANNNSIFEAAFSGIPCESVNNDAVCIFTSPGAISGFENGVSSGLFVLPGPPPPWAVVATAPIPTLGRASSLLLTTALGLLGLLLLRRLS